MEMMIKIFLDPGHGGSDSGAIANGLQEKNITLAIAKRIELSLLRDYENVSVKMSRVGDQTVSLRARTSSANRWGADFYLSIHVNAGGGTGYEDYVYRKSAKSSRTTQLRAIIHSEVVKLSSLRNRGKKTANFHVLRETKMPALLTECGFIDHQEDSKKMKQAFWLDSIARGHVNGLAKALGLIKKSKDVPFIQVITPSLWTYYTPHWADRAIVVEKGEVFTVTRDKFKVGNGYMYHIKSGLYITANSKYVRAYTL